MFVVAPSVQVLYAVYLVSGSANMPSICMLMYCTMTFYCVCLRSVWHLPSSPGRTSSWQTEIAHSLSHFITGPTEFKGLSKTNLRSLATSLIPGHSCTTGVEWHNLASELLKRPAVVVKYHR